LGTISSQAPQLGIWRWEVEMRRAASWLKVGDVSEGVRGGILLDGAI
jgi:hypothetical protein